MSSIKSQNSMYMSEINYFLDDDISMESQNMKKKNAIPRNLEDFILIKLPQSDINMINYDLNEGMVEYRYKDHKDKSYKFKFKYNTTKEKNYIKILLILESYKYSIKYSLIINQNDIQRKRNMSLRNRTLMTKRRSGASKQINDNALKVMSQDLINY